MRWRGGGRCGRGGVADLARAMQALVPDSVAVAWADPFKDHALLPGEALPRAITARHCEFSAGRVAARRAMALLGLPAAPILRGEDRAPIWPEGITGSITHTKTDALAAVTQARCLVGIDMERDGRVEPQLWPTILHADEDSTRATLIFAAKEAVYKAQYPLTQLLFDFHRLHVRIDGPRFHARFTASTGPIAAGTIWTGCHALLNGVIITAVHIPA
jgi:4'-phosphopantetheinyl transferase EntD